MKMNETEVGRSKPTLCVVNYNGAKFLPDSLAAAAVQRDSFAEVIVVDNASEDESVALIERQFPWIRVERLSSNGGPPAARNAGLREARSDLLLFIDNDVSLAEDCVERLAEALREHPRAAIAIPSVIYAHDRDLVQYDGADSHFIGLMVLHNQDRPVADADQRPRAVGNLATACFLIDRRRIPSDTTFDESFFYMFEDHDFGLRVRALGAEIVSVPQARCYHGKGTEGLSIRQLGTYSSKRVYFIIRNRWLIILKNFSARTIFVLAPVLAAFEIAQLLLVLKKRWTAEWWRALTWIVRHWAVILKERRRVQALRRVSDRELLVGGPVPFRRELTTSGFERAARSALDAIATGYWKIAQRLI